MDFNLADDDRRWVEVARDFVRRVIAPEVAARERIDDPARRLPWEWIREADRVGLRRLCFPRELGGGGAGIVTLSLVAEELAAGDMGFTAFLDQIWKMAPIFCEAMTDQQRQRYLQPLLDDPTGLTCIAFTESGAGSDHQGYYVDPGIDFETTATRDGDGWVLNGAKSFPFNIGVARVYFIAARTDRRTSLAESGSIFCLLGDEPGLIQGKTFDKIGQRISVNAEMRLENVRLPAESLIAGEGRLFEIRSRYLPGSKAESAALNLGVARAALDCANAWAAERHAGCPPTAEQQGIAELLEDLATRLEAARRLNLRAAWLADRRDPQTGVAGLLTKTYSSETAILICREVLQLLGPRGIQRDEPVEKLFRDASTSTHSDGTNQLALLRAVRALSGAESFTTVGGF